MKSPLFPAIAAGDPSGVVNIALYELGLSEAFLLEAFRRVKGRPKFKEGQWDVSQVAWMEWEWICKKLHLPLDSYSSGYERMTHKLRVGQALLEGSFVLPLLIRS